MGHYYLSPWVETTTPRGVGFRPPVNSAFNVVDLRPDPTVVEGRCLLWVPDRLPLREAQGMINLGDDARSVLPLVARVQLANELGLNLQRDTLSDLAAELLLDHAREDGTRVRPLRFKRRTRVDPSDGFRRPYRGIWLGGERIWEQFYRSGPGAAYSEDWTTGTNGDSPNNDLTWAEVTNDWDISSGEVTVTGSGASALRAEHDMASDDHYSEGTVSGGVTTTYHDAEVRFHASAATYYGYYRRWSGGDQGLQKYVSGSFTDLANEAVGGLSGGDVIRCEVDGSDLEGFLNAVSEITVTDTSITGHTRAGVGGYSNGSNRTQFTAWSGGDLAAATEYNEPVAITITSSDSVADEVHRYEDLLVAAVSSATISDIAQRAEVLTMLVQSDVTVSDLLSAVESIAATITSTVTVDDIIAFIEELAINGVSSVTVDDLIAFVEGLQVDTSATVSVADVQTMVEDALAMVVSATVNETDVAQRVETLGVVATGSVSLAIALPEPLTIALAAVLSVADSRTLVDAETISAVATVAVSDIAERVESVSFTIDGFVTEVDFFDDGEPPVPRVIAPGLPGGREGRYDRQSLVGRGARTRQRVDLG